MRGRKFNSQLRLRQRAKATAVAFGVVIAITLGLLCVLSRFSELKGKDEAYHLTQYLRAPDQSAFAEDTERELQHPMTPTSNPSTTPTHLITRKAEQGQIRHLLLGRTIGSLFSSILPTQKWNPTIQRTRLRTMPPANTLTTLAHLEAEQGTNTTESSSASTEADSSDVNEEIFQNFSTAAGSAAISSDAEVGDIDARMHNGEWVFAPHETEASGSDDSDSSSDSIDCSSDDSMDSSSKDSDDSGSDSDSSDSVSTNCNEITSIMNKW